MCGWEQTEPYWHVSAGKAPSSSLHVLYDVVRLKQMLQTPFEGGVIVKCLCYVPNIMNPPSYWTNYYVTLVYNDDSECGTRWSWRQTCLCQLEAGSIVVVPSKYNVSGEIPKKKISKCAIKTLMSSGWIDTGNYVFGIYPDSRGMSRFVYGQHSEVERAS